MIAPFEQALKVELERLKNLQLLVTETSANLLF